MTIISKVSNPNIPKQPEESVFDDVGLTAFFGSSLAPYHRQWSLAPDAKNCVDFLSDSRCYGLLRYIPKISDPNISKISDPNISKVSDPKLNKFDSVFVTKVMHYVDYVAIAARRVFQAIPSQANGLLLPIAGFCSGFMDFVNSSIDLGSALKSWNSSTNIGDGEGQRRAGARCAQNTFSIPASIGSSIQYIVHLVPHVAPQAVAIVTGAILGYVLSSLYGVVALVGIGLGALGIYRNSTFRSNLNAGDRAGDVWKQDEEIVKTLKFLQNKIGVTADASDALETAGESNPSDDKLNQKKFEYVKRRTSEDVAKRLQAAATVDKDGQSEIGDWIRALNNSVDLGFSPKAVERDKWRDATRKAAIELINDVKKANRDNTRIQLFSLVVSILSFVGILLMSLSTAGVLPLSLLGIASVISMGRLWHRL